MGCGASVGNNNPAPSSNAAPRSSPGDTAKLLQQEDSKHFAEEVKLLQFQSNVRLHTDIARKWFWRALRSSVADVVQQTRPDHDLSFGADARVGFLSLSKAESEKLRQRIRQIVDSILNSVNEVCKGSLPEPLKVFIAQLTSDGVYFPSSSNIESTETHFPAGFERRVLEFDAAGATKGMTQPRKRILILSFLSTQVIIPLLLDPSSHMVSQPITGVPRRNLRIIASVIYMATCQCLRGLISFNAIPLSEPLRPQKHLLPRLLPMDDEMIVSMVEPMSSSQLILLATVNNLLEPIETEEKRRTGAQTPEPEPFKQDYCEMCKQYGHVYYDHISDR